MTNIATVLKAEIVRVARKEIRSELEGLKKASAQHRSAIAELKRELAAMQKQLKQAERERTASAREKTAVERKHRFSATRLAAHRTKLGLSAADYGRLVGMSGATIYLWERGESRPRPEQVRQLGLLKAMNRSVILKQLAQVKGGEAVSG
jgi:DNA-binding transcriptional regulator YiaG